MHHRDPFDRLLIAQAEIEGHVLVTADGWLGDYEVEILWQ
jgi:PIN domain nuclease of toxin-antitoxin system